MSQWPEIEVCFKLANLYLWLASSTYPNFKPKLSMVNGDTRGIDY